MKWKFYISKSVVFPFAPYYWDKRDVISSKPPFEDPY